MEKYDVYVLSVNVEENGEIGDALVLKGVYDDLGLAMQKSQELNGRLEKESSNQTIVMQGFNLNN